MNATLHPWGKRRLKATVTGVIGRVLRVGHPLQDLEGHGLLLGVGAHVDVDGRAVDLRPGPVVRLAPVVRLDMAHWWLAVDTGQGVVTDTG